MKPGYRILTLLLALFSLAIHAAPAQRIIALSPHSVEMLYAIGAGDRIIGTVEYADYPEAALSIPRIGSYAGVQIEKVLAMQPDVVVVWAGGNREADVAKLRSLGLNLYDSTPHSIADIASDLLALGRLTGLEDKAQQVADNMMARYAAIKKRYASKTKVKVFYQMWHDPFRTIGPNSWLEYLINDCNGRNVFHDADAPYPVVTLESVLARDPQVIVIPDHGGDVGAKKAIWQSWPEVDAVKHQRLRIIDGNLLHRFTPRSVDGLEKLCEAVDSARS